jgi:hypothetical protein
VTTLRVRVENAPPGEVAVPCGSTHRLNARDVERKCNAILDAIHRYAWRAASPLGVVFNAAYTARERVHILDAHGRRASSVLRVE